MDKSVAALHDDKNDISDNTDEMNFKDRRKVDHVDSKSAFTWSLDCEEETGIHAGQFCMTSLTYIQTDDSVGWAFKPLQTTKSASKLTYNWHSA